MGVRHRRARGMTLIEIMVVLVILGLMSTLIGVAVLDNLHRAKVRKAQLDCKALENALELYSVHKGKYPDRLEVLAETRTIPRLEHDPWGNPYVLTMKDGAPAVISYGADGQPGGEGKDADIASGESSQ